MDKSDAKVEFGRSLDPKDNRNVSLPQNMQFTYISLDPVHVHCDFLINSVL